MDITTLQAGLVGNDALTRMILNHDNSTVFFNLGGGLFVLRTADATLSGSRTVFNQGDYELALAGNEASMTAAEFLLDTKQNGLAFLALNERKVWNETAVHGEKLSPEGTLLFRPLTDALDVLAGGTGILRTRSHVKKESSGWREVRESPNRRVNDAPKTRIA